MPISGPPGALQAENSPTTPPAENRGPGGDGTLISRLLWWQASNCYTSRQQMAARLKVSKAELNAWFLLKKYPAKKYWSRLAERGVATLEELERWAPKRKTRDEFEKLLEVSAQLRRQIDRLSRLEKTRPLTRLEQNCRSVYAQMVLAARQVFNDGEHFSAYMDKSEKLLRDLEKHPIFKLHPGVTFLPAEGDVQ